METIVIALGIDKGLDLATGGWVNKQSKKVLVGTLKRLATPIGRVGASVGGALGRSAIGAAAPLAANPFIGGTALGLAALQTPQGQDLLEWAEEKGRRDRVAFEQYKADVGMRMQDFASDPLGYAQDLRPDRPMGGRLAPSEALLGKLGIKKRKKSKYNRAVSAAMKAVKASTKGGKKGKISSPKTVFKTVSKAVSKVNKGAKVSAKGVTGIAARAARRILGKRKKKPKKRSKGYTITVNR